MRLKIFIALAVVWMPLGLYAKFDFNENCQKAFASVFDLKLNTARALLAQERQQNPTNDFIPLLENYIDYFYVYTSGNKKLFDQLKQYKNSRLQAIKDKDSPFYLYAQAEINLQWALLRGQYGEFLNAALEIRRANNLLKENSQKFPSFALNDKNIGFIQIMIGVLPEGTLKGTLSTFGLKGDVNAGTAKLERLLQQIPSSTYRVFYTDIAFSYIHLLNDVLKSKEAYNKALRYSQQMRDSSLLKTYTLSYTALKHGKNDMAMRALADRPGGNFYVSFPELSYLEGLSYLYKLNLASAEKYFQLFLKQSTGEKLLKDVYLRLAWIDLLKNDVNGYKSNIALLQKKGASYEEKDKQAKSEAGSAMPNAQLLRARLLFDGGYFNEALTQLKNKQMEDFGNAKDKTEFGYRLGRIYDALGEYDAALPHYQQAVDMGRNLKYFYASNAALQMGRIYESLKRYADAKAAYETAIEMKNHEYENSIESQAKAALRSLPR